MVTYKSVKGRTISVGRLQISADPGVSLETADETLDQLVVEGFLTKEVEGAPATAATAKATTEKVVPKVESQATTTKSK